MSDPKNPPAFPMGDPVNGGYDGMTLRDWFAGQALPQLLPALLPKGLGEGHLQNNATAAVVAYAIADAILAERERSQ